MWTLIARAQTSLESLRTPGWPTDVSPVPIAGRTSKPKWSTDSPFRRSFASYVACARRVRRRYKTNLGRSSARAVPIGAVPPPHNRPSAGSFGCRDPRPQPIPAPGARPATESKPNLLVATSSGPARTTPVGPDIAPSRARTIARPAMPAARSESARCAGALRFRRRPAQPTRPARHAEPSPLSKGIWKSPSEPESPPPARSRVATRWLIWRCSCRVACLFGSCSAPSSGAGSLPCFRPQRPIARRGSERLVVAVSDRALGVHG